MATIKKQIEKSLTAAHFLANLVHPQCMGASLAADQKQQARYLLRDRASDNMIPLLYEYSAGV